MDANDKILSSEDATNEDAKREAPNGSRDESWFDQLVRDISQSGIKVLDKARIEQCFDYFKSKDASNAKDGLTFENFCNLINELFVDHSNDSNSVDANSEDANTSDTNGEEEEKKKMNSFYIPKSYYIELFQKFDKNHDQLIDRREFSLMWSKWIQTILVPKSAFIIVDVQNDFINGSLAIYRCPAGHKGEEVIPVINKLLENVPFELVVYSYDWHPADHISFYENYRKRKIIARNGVPIEESDAESDANSDGNNGTTIQVFEEVTFEGPPRTDQKLWPKHCVQGSWGSSLHPDVIQLQDENKYINIFKGTKSNIDSYSAFWDNNKLSETGLASTLKERGITDVYVCGLAYDVCVGATSEHAVEYGFRTTLINDASRGVDAKAIEKTKNNLINKSAVVVDSDRVPDMVSGMERRPEHAYHLALFIK